jgi:hypothetical protein
VNEEFLIIQYADDTLLIMQACPRQLLCLKRILETFAQSTGLRVNLAKSCLLPINVSKEKVTLLAGLFGCKLETFPFTYLGLPLGLSRLRIRDLGPLYSRINHRLAATASFLSFDGRILVTKAILSSLPTFYLSNFKLADGAIEIVDKSRRIGVWGKMENSNRPKSLAAWELVCRPKSKGGLGISNLASHNEALLIKFLHKFFNKDNIPWVHLIWKSYNNSTPQASNISSSFWWRDIVKLCSKFKRIASCSIATGGTALF